jgi:hypothetical protein
MEATMHYMLMCCIDERAWNGLPQAERDGVMRDYHAWVDDLVARGTYVAGGKLDDSATATTVRRQGGRAVFTDGPFAETKEQLGGFHILDCANLDDALALARRIPTLPVGGTIEVRPMIGLLGTALTAATADRPALAATSTEVA